jgi:hypothetical protein
MASERANMTTSRRNLPISFRKNAAMARSLWSALPPAAIHHLKELTRKHRLSIAAGDLLLLEGRWYVTHAGLLRLAERRRCMGIKTWLDRHLSDPKLSRWVCRALVYKAGSKTFTGYGDADPGNISPLVRGAEMRIAETRAVNRALRKAYGIGLCSVEELGYLRSCSDPPAGTGNAQPHPNGNPSGNGHPRLRDRLCLLIREHQLDPTLVKRYAADFCGTQELREASRDLVESFISHLGEWAAKDRAALICKLNGYAQAEEVRT